MISFNHVCLSRGSKKLLDDVSFLFSKGNRVGVVGRNGSGKTSLFRAILDEIHLESGNIDKPSDLRLSLMEQETPGTER